MVWIGTSVESQKYAPRLTVPERLPAAVRFVSAEPLLERIDLRPWLERGALNWVIAGGESGPGARSMDPDWVRDLRDQSIDNRLCSRAHRNADGWLTLSGLQVIRLGV